MDRHGETAGEGSRGDTPSGAIDLLVALTPWWWGFAVLFFGVGDVTLTLFALETGLAVEAGPVVVVVVRRHGLVAIPLLKGGVFALAYLEWRAVPPPHNVGVPLALAVMGVGVTAWNLLVLAGGAGLP